MANHTLESIDEPLELDVLFGRGGMSNHHPGNVWYRRLIRCNRPLYQACPKHTKLQVSKAIVQAVEQQSGRFLELDKKQGVWFVVQYKRAVDKTSQALREKGRDCEEGGDDVGGKDMNMDAIRVPMAVKGSHSSRTNTLNEVASAMMRLTALPLSSQDPNDASLLSSPSLLSEHSARAVATQKRSLNDSRIHDSDVYKRAKLENNIPLITQKNGMFSSAMDAHQSSVSRMMKRSQFLQPDPNIGNVRTDWSNIVNQQAQFQNANRICFNNQGNRPAAIIDTQRLPPTSIRIIPRTIDGPVIPSPIDAMLDGPSSMLNPHDKSGYPNPSQVYSSTDSSYPAASASAPAPALTRLTSQFSDWLSSFWPLQGKAEADRNGQCGYPSDPLESDPFETDCPILPISSSLNQKNTFSSERFNPPPSTPCVNTGARLPDAIQNMIQIPESLNVAEHKPIITILPPPTRHDVDNQIKHMNRVSDPMLLHNNDLFGNQNLTMSEAEVKNDTLEVQHVSPDRPYFDESRRAATPLPELPTTNLESSISTTLSKFVSSPSKLLSGLSGCFVDRSTQATDAGILVLTPMSLAPVILQPQNPLPTTQQQQVTLNRTMLSKSTKSLLNDDEDTPLEARLRLMAHGSPTKSMHVK